MKPDPAGTTEEAAETATEAALVARIAARGKVGAPQVVFRFAQAVGMLPLTGTSSAEHMRQDLEGHALSLSDDEAGAIESLAG